MRELKVIEKFRAQQNLDDMPIKTLHRNCVFYGFRVELWKYGTARTNRSDYRNRNKLVLYKEEN